MFSFLKWFSTPATDFKGLVNDGALILDVRTNSEFNDGHCKGSKNIPLNNLSIEIEKLKKINKPIITVCRSGSRSSLAKSTLKAAGLEVYNGGSWTSLQSKL